MRMAVKSLLIDWPNKSIDFIGRCRVGGSAGRRANGAEVDSNLGLGSMDDLKDEMFTSLWVCMH